MKKILLLTLLAAGITATAQVKIGNNPTTLATDANFQVEGTATTNQFIVLKNGNVGIGTSAPNASSILELASSTKALLLPRVLGTNSIATPIDGMIVYDFSSNCFKGYQNGAWTACGFIPETPSNLVLIQIGKEGDSPDTVNSVVTVAQINTITPTITGALLANQTAYQDYIDANPNLFDSPATAVQVQNMVNAVNATTQPSIASITCTPAFSPATATQNSAYTGTTTATYTGGNGVAYSTATYASTGVTGLTLTLTAGTLTSSTGTLNYTVTGTPATAGTASFAITFGGQTCTKTITVNAAAPSIASIDCTPAFSPATATQNSTYNGTTTATYTGGNGAAYSTATYASTGVTGLTLTLTAGTLTSSTGTLNYTVTGTPATAGTASFAITFGGQTCTKTITVNVLVGSITSINCAGATANGTLTNGVAATGVSSVISYSGGNAGVHNGQTVTSTGVSGLTATLAAGTFANGTGTLTYNITGTPSASGTASFAINIGGQTCNLTRAVATIVPATITLAQNRSHVIASVFDQDYLPYTAPVGAATTAKPVAANGANEAVTVNIQGSITTGGFAIKIPVTATGSNTLPAFSHTINIPAGMTEDGISRDVTLSWAAQAYTATTTSINATIAAEGGTLNAKKLDINAGIGNDGLGVLMGQFTYPYNNAGATTTYSIRDIAGIPDRNIADANHRMLYLPVLGADGNIWLNNNLGANYSNTVNAAFNLAQQATSALDLNAYGSKFQWGRKADGHELLTYPDFSIGASVNGITSTNSNAPADALFITEPNSPFDWRVSQDVTLWATEASANNPCPIGFRVPTTSEYDNLETLANITNNETAFSSTLKFTTAGYRNYQSGLNETVSTNGFYWSSSVNGISSLSWFTNASGSNVGRISNRAAGMSVRCIKD